MKILNDFDLFINSSNNSILLSSYQCIDFVCLRDCSYVRYIVTETINGELNGFPFVVPFESLYDYILGDYYVIALNYLDNLCLEVR